MAFCVLIISYLLQPWFQSNQIHTLYFVYICIYLDRIWLDIKNNHLNLKSTCNQTYESHFIFNASITHWNDTLFHLLSFFFFALWVLTFPLFCTFVCLYLIFLFCVFIILLAIAQNNGTPLTTTRIFDSARIGWAYGSVDTKECAYCKITISIYFSVGFSSSNP